MTSGPTDGKMQVDPTSSPTVGEHREQAPPPPAAPPVPPPPNVVPPASPQLPRATAPPPSVAAVPTTPDTTTTPMLGSNPPVAVVYRSDRDRQRRVYRRANPLWHRFARAVVALGIITAVGIGVLLGVREIRNFLDRDRLPTAGVEIPDIRWSTYAIASTSPAPTLSGTLTIDRVTGAFEYVEAPSAFRVGVQIVSPDGVSAFVQRGDSAWLPTGDSDLTVGEVRRAITFLDGIDSADAILENRLRRGYIDLVRQGSEGVDDNERTRYELLLNTAAYSDDYPLQWSNYREEVIPGVVVGRDVPVVMWIDRDNVITQFSAPQSNWEWQRLDYGSDAIRIDAPTTP